MQQKKFNCKKKSTIEYYSYLFSNVPPAYRSTTRSDSIDGLGGGGGATSTTGAGAVGFL